MRILYFLAHPEGLGGASNVLLKQANLMKRVGHDVSIVIQDNDEHNHSRVIDDACEKYGLEYMSYSFSIALCIEEIDIERSIQDKSAIKEIIDEFNADIVHSLQFNVSVELACRELNVPHVMSIYPFSNGMFNLKWDDVFPRYLVTDSDYYCKKWGTGLGIEAKTIRVSYEKRNLNIQKKESQSGYELLSIGLFCSYKNQLEIIKFIEKVVSGGISLRAVFLGECDNAYGEACKRYVEEHNLSEVISITGFAINVEDYLNSADLLIHASKKESYPGVIVEAMANRIPVMVTPVGGIPELVKDRENGFFINGFESDDIVEAFKNFITSKENGTLLEIIDRGYRTYLDNHRGEVVCDELENFYIHIIQNTNIKSNLPQITEEMMSKKMLSQCNGEYSSFTQCHKWFLSHIFRGLVKDRIENAYIWGAGNYGKYALEWCNILNLKVKGIFDSYKEGSFQGYAICKPDIKILEPQSVILVAIFDFDVVRTIVEYLEGNGFVRNENFFLLRNDSCM